MDARSEWTLRRIIEAAQAHEVVDKLKEVVTQDSAAGVAGTAGHVEGSEVAQDMAPKISSNIPKAVASVVSKAGRTSDHRVNNEDGSKS